ncbi:hypothetical protein JTB14_013310 [Gonioctena quinquepunctata]|nr:hypothetical protein JTB14_013310 [Gonioctena quinquepunctata]
MCILKLLRLHVTQKHRRQQTTNFMNSKNFINAEYVNFYKSPFRSNFGFPEFMLMATDDEVEDAETLTTSLIDSMCSDFIFKGNVCDCREFHEKLREKERR